MQVLLGRRYVVENPGYSDIFTKSPFALLRKLVFYLVILDGCAVGARSPGVRRSGKERISRGRAPLKRSP